MESRTNREIEEMSKGEKKPHTTYNKKWLTYWCNSHYVSIQLFNGANSSNSKVSTKFHKVILT